MLAALQFAVYPKRYRCDGIEPKTVGKALLACERRKAPADSGVLLRHTQLHWQPDTVWRLQQEPSCQFYRDTLLSSIGLAFASYEVRQRADTVMYVLNSLVIAYWATFRAIITLYSEQPSQLQSLRARSVGELQCGRSMPASERRPRRYLYVRSKYRPAASSTDTCEPYACPRASTLDPSIWLTPSTHTTAL